MKRILYPLIFSALLFSAFFIEGITSLRAPSATDHLYTEYSKVETDSIEFPPNFNDVVRQSVFKIGSEVQDTPIVKVNHNIYTLPEQLSAIQVNIMGKSNQPYWEGYALIYLTGSKDTTAEFLGSQIYFNNLDASGFYTVRPTNEWLPLNGVTTYDLLLMQAHILGKKKIVNPYLLIAGDVNKDCKISISDIIELRKMLLGPGIGFSNNTSWRFVDANYVFPNPLKPCNFPEEVFFPVLSQPVEFAFFRSIKIGDLSGDAALQGDAETRQASGELLFTTSDRQFKAGEELEVVIRASDFEDIQGYQYTLDFDPEVLELVALTPVWSALDANHFGDSRAREGQILTSWIDVDGVTLPDGEALYTLRFRTKATGRLSHHLRMSDLSLRAEAYAADETHLDVQLRFDEQASNQSAFQLYPNQPNPVGETTTIGFRLPEACRATLSIYSVTGQLVYQVSGHYPGGYSAIVINRSDLPQDGVLFYELQTPTHRATKRMVVAE